MEVFSFERRIKNYSNYQNILLVGEGDFSFAVCLARAFGFVANIVATSRDTRESLMVEYSKAMSNVEELESRECTVSHEVDVHYMSRHPFLTIVLFDRIIYNFPHAGYLRGSRSRESDMYQIWYHQDLVRGFLENAREMLTRVGEIHVTHKTKYPFSEWTIVDLAYQAGLDLVHEEPFSKWDYPGYENKRGAGMFDQTFPAGMCSTYKFRWWTILPLPVSTLALLLRVHGLDIVEFGVLTCNCKPHHMKSVFFLSFVVIFQYYVH